MGQRIATVVLFLSCSLEAGSASARPREDARPTAASLGLVPRGVYVQVPPRPRDPQAGQAIAGRGGRMVLFLNRGGGSYEGSWWDDSTSNESSILDFGVDLPPYPYGDRSWNAVLDCMREVYAPFDIEVTDVDPGRTTHVEVVVSGHPRDIGQQDGVGGIAPMACDVIDNAVAYAFPETYGDDPSGICEAAAQESAHAFGLDHEMQCDDVMTYLWCGSKSFTDVDAACGEYRDRSCACGGDTQNSYRYLLSILGPAEEANEPPRVAITSPSDGAEVGLEFVVEVEADDDVGVSSLDLYIDGDRADSLDAPPWRFTTASTLAPGEHELEVRATDGASATGTDSITVRLLGDAEPDPEGEGETGPVPGVLGELGDDCDESSMCASNACVVSDGYCTERCPEGSCSEGFECTGTEQGDYCLRIPGTEEPRRSRGCTIGTPSAPPVRGLAVLALTLLGLLFRRARRRESCSNLRR